MCRRERARGSWCSSFRFSCCFLLLLCFFAKSQNLSSSPSCHSFDSTTLASPYFWLMFPRPIFPPNIWNFWAVRGPPYMRLHLPFSIQGLFFLSGAWIRGSDFSCSSMYSFILKEMNRFCPWNTPALNFVEYVAELQNMLQLFIFLSSPTRMTYISDTRYIIRECINIFLGPNSALLHDISVGLRVPCAHLNL